MAQDGHQYKNGCVSRRKKVIDSNAGKSCCSFRRLAVSRKSRARRGVRGSLSGAYERKIPFAIMELRSGNCITKSKGPYLRNPPVTRAPPIVLALKNKPAQMSERPCACESDAGILWLCPHMPPALPGNHSCAFRRQKQRIAKHRELSACIGHWDISSNKRWVSGGSTPKRRSRAAK